MLSIWYICFCKQKTAYEMRISDWSSDVCSSDLEHDNRHIGGLGVTTQAATDLDPRHAFDHPIEEDEIRRIFLGEEHRILAVGGMRDFEILAQIGSASCRERVCQYV